MEQLVAFRGVQGLGAGALEGLTFILVADLYAGRRNAALQGAMAGLMGMSFILGPLLGGFIADSIGWRWVFLVNLPIGARGARGRRDRAPRLASAAARTGGMPLDLTGHRAAHARDRARARRPERASTLALRSSPGLAVPLAAFVAVERRASAPIIPLRAVRRTARPARSWSPARSARSGCSPACCCSRATSRPCATPARRTPALLIYPLLIGLIVSVNVAGA